VPALVLVAVRGPLGSDSSGYAAGCAHRSPSAPSAIRSPPERYPGLKTISVTMASTNAPEP